MRLRQWQHGFPTLEDLRNVKATGKNVVLGPLAFIGQQVMSMHPITLPLWLSGLGFFLWGRGRRYRALGLTYLALLVAFIVLAGKSYYLFPAYPMLFAGGAVAVAGWLDRLPLPAGRIWTKAAIIAALALTGGVTAPLALPLLTPESYLAYERALGMERHPTEVHHEGPLPQLFGDQFCWEDLVAVRYTDENPPQLIYDQDYDRMTVKALDLSLNCWLSLPTDVVPLSMSILPADGTPELAHMLRVPLSSEGFFEEAQLKLRPMDFMREGIFLAGMAHYPKFIEESISHALAGAARALTLLAWDSLYLGGVVAKVDPDRCVGCLTCTRTCPFGIPQVIQMEGRLGVGGLGGAAYIDAGLCQLSGVTLHPYPMP